jgi:hypothetical protein
LAQYKERRQTKQNTENLKDEQHGPTKKRGMKPGSRDGQAVSVS